GAKENAILVLRKEVAHGLRVKPAQDAEARSALDVEVRKPVERFRQLLKLEGHAAEVRADERRLGMLRHDIVALADQFLPARHLRVAIVLVSLGARTVVKTVVRERVPVLFG